MTTPGSRSVSYLCPQCNAALTAREDDAGQRQACTQCGKMIKVPGRPSAPPGSGTARAPAQGAAPQTAGVANVAVLCPICGTRMYATREQLGKSMVCPDCLETVPVPASPSASRPPKASIPRPAATRPAATQPAATQPATTGNAPQAPRGATPAPAKDSVADDDDGGLRLSDPIDIPSDKVLPQRFSELLRDGQPAPDSEDVADWPVEPATTPTKSPSPPRASTDDEYSVKCPVCDTLLYASPDEIGKRKDCPDCHSSVEIKAPRRKPRRVDPVREEDYEGHEFVLSEPVPVDIHRQTEQGKNPKTMGEDALRNAEREYERKHAEEDVEPPASPLWTGLFSFFPASPVILRWVVFALLIGLVCKLSLLIHGWNVCGGPIQHFYSLAGMTARSLLFILTTLSLGATCLAILQDTANGQDEISQWPEGGLFGMLAGAFPFAMAVFFSLLPGIILYTLAGVVGVMEASRWIFLEFSLYLLFPVVQLSILESDSLTMPFSQPILRSLRDEFLLWFTFYLTSLALALIVAVMYAGVTWDTSFLVLLVMGAVWIFLLFLYFRLLGRLAWATQVRSLLKDDPEIKNDSEAKT